MRRMKFVVLVALVALVIIVMAGCGSAPKHHTNPNAVVTMSQPPTASEVAANVGCENFKDMGSAKLYAIDSGTCWVGSVKYGVDTFPSATARNSWIKLAESLGTNPPKWETSTAVVYKAHDQSR